jgi:hypothetical protein
MKIKLGFLYKLAIQVISKAHLDYIKRSHFQFAENTEERITEAEQFLEKMISYLSENDVNV